MQSGSYLCTLDRLDLADHTVVVFTSDNGGVSAGDGKATSNLPLRGGKGRQWEGGIREPYYIKWPGHGNGKKCDTPATGTDFYPTLLEIAGIDAKPNQHVDGVSLVPLFDGKKIEERFALLALPPLRQSRWGSFFSHRSGRLEADQLPRKRSKRAVQLAQ